MPSGYEHLSLTLSACALGSVALHCALVPWAPTLSAFLAPVHASCCGLLLLLLHPGVGALLERIRILGDRADSLMLMSDPVVAAAMQQPPPPPPWRHTLFALALHALADVLPAPTGAANSLGALALEGAHEMITAASVSCLLYASWNLGSPPSTSLAAMCWGVALCVGLQMLLTTPLPEGRGDLGTAALACSGLAAARTLLSCALAAQGACAACGALLAPGRGTSHCTVPPLAADVPRWGAQAAGSLLLLAPPVLAAYLPTGGGAFALILERLGVAALTVSAYLANFPQVGALLPMASRLRWLPERFPSASRALFPF